MEALTRVSVEVCGEVCVAGGGLCVDARVGAGEQLEEGFWSPRCGDGGVGSEGSSGRGIERQIGGLA